MISINQSLKEMAKEDVQDFIRGIRSSNELGSFDFSGYESITGVCTLGNMKILNAFAFLGIYDYTEFLFLDFYKGIPRLYFKYWCDEKYQNHEDDLIGSSTSEIIYKIFEITIFTDKQKRRRY
jgi:hypothetical protein